MNWLEHPLMAYKIHEDSIGLLSEVKLRTVTRHCPREFHIKP